ncbi:MAG TPA: amino acid ABC transporter substrate-binding protein [Sedimentibacter sp.]|jgi:polar amino acid transport system substrate-binding protein|nr:amino acid ABC transporter substrate-binding protein [Tissierellia bacterium]HOA20763.1 amino acid ABC transporter substrate-binding protein [Sedimentibacter sp.]HOT22213.1 amino acid ABC transporter substrate-binding protein [Sedimentibacter sp.]HPB80170.1 amino acid ABC transporter substrate-binding protein [Sedimentibacter sp.]HQC70575.1 amino acid ABC transporter substrate-binding protein [Sedimentibacter sp.]
MKKNVSKKVKLAVLLILTAILAVGCAAQSSQPETEELIMGLDDTFAPMGFRDEKGELVGFDVDLANEVAERIGVTIKFQPIDWSMKETELNAGNIDLIWNGYTITAERQEKVAFTKPYLENSQIIVTLADSDINTKVDLAGKNVAVQAESSALDAINSEPEVAESFGELVEFSTNNEAFSDLESGRTDALVVDEVNARYFMKQVGEEKYKVLDEDFGDEEYGIGLRKEDTELLKKINDAMDEMKKDGTYDAIYAKWFSEN